MQVLAGNPQSLFYTAVAAAVYCALRGVRVRARRLFLLGLAGILQGGTARNSRFALWLKLLPSSEPVRRRRGWATSLKKAGTESSWRRSTIRTWSRSGGISIALIMMIVPLLGVLLASHPPSEPRAAVETLLTFTAPLLRLFHHTRWPEPRGKDVSGRHKRGRVCAASRSQSASSSKPRAQALSRCVLAPACRHAVAPARCRLRPPNAFCPGRSFCRQPRPRMLTTFLKFSLARSLPQA